jgi:NAD(P)-dependent dehydrogenase (short-subunit alcohol dehydrogenase family)
MDLGIRGRTAIACAASRGLGWAIAIALAHEGVNLVINARSEAALAAGDRGGSLAPCLKFCLCGIGHALRYMRASRIVK